MSHIPYVNFWDPVWDFKNQSVWLEFDIQKKSKHPYFDEYESKVHIQRPFVTRDEWVGHPWSKAYLQVDNIKPCRRSRGDGLPPQLPTFFPFSRRQNRIKDFLSFRSLQTKRLSDRSFVQTKIKICWGTPLAVLWHSCRASGLIEKRGSYLNILLSCESLCLFSFQWIKKNVCFMFNAKLVMGPLFNRGPGLQALKPLP